MARRAASPLKLAPYPTLVGTAIPTRVIAGRFDAGESLESLMEDFVRPQEDILEAIRWERRERRAA